MRTWTCYVISVFVYHTPTFHKWSCSSVSSQWNRADGWLNQLTAVSSVLCLCPSWLYKFFFFFLMCVCVCSWRAFYCCRKKKKKKDRESLSLHQQSSEQRPNWQHSQTKHLLHILPALRALPVSTYKTHAQTGPILLKTNTQYFFNKGLTTAL